MNAIRMEAASAFLLFCAVKSLVLLGIAWGVSAGWRRASAAQQRLWWILTFASLLLLPLLVRIVPPWHLAVLPSPTPVTPSGTLVPETVSLPRPTPLMGAPPDVSPPSSPSDHLPLPLLVWGIGCLGVLLRQGIGMVHLRRLVGQSAPLHAQEWQECLADLAKALRLPRPVTLYIGGPTTSHQPLTWGWWHPKVWLPPCALQWSAERRRVVLFHELTHIQHGDSLVRLLTTMTCALYWFHPVLWLAARRLHLACERACDDHVLSTGVSAPDYARHLLEVIQAMQRQSPLLEAAVTLGRPSTLEIRLRAILSERISRQGVSRHTLIGSLSTALAFLGLLATVQLDAVAQRQAAPPPVASKPVTSAKPLPPEKIVTVTIEESPFEQALKTLFMGSKATYTIPQPLMDLAGHRVISMHCEDTPLSSALKTLIRSKGLRSLGMDCRREGERHYVIFQTPYPSGSHISAGRPDTPDGRWLKPEERIIDIDIANMDLYDLLAILLRQVTEKSKVDPAFRGTQVSVYVKDQLFQTALETISNASKRPIQHGYKNGVLSVWLAEPGKKKTNPPPKRKP